MATIQITENERNLLTAIRDNDFQDGEHPVSNKIWVDCIPGWSDNKRFGGVMASLTKKGLAKTDGEVCWMTQDGFDLIGAAS